MNDFNNEDFENGYINVPVALFRAYYRGVNRSLGTFVTTVIAWGVATGQIADFSCDSFGHITCQEGIGKERLYDWLNAESIKPSEVHLSARKFLGSEQECSNKEVEVGVTFSALDNMLFSQFRNKREEARIGDCWMIYLALKSVVGKAKSTQGRYTWDNILNRALGSIPLTKNICRNADKDWTAQYRCGKSVQSRKKMDVITRLVNGWGVTYSPKDPETGKNRRVPIFSLSKKR